MTQNIQRKCASCGTWNGNVDRCSNCNTTISLKALEKIEQKQKTTFIAQQPEHPLDTLALKLKKHPFFLVRWIYHIVNSIFIFFMAIGSLIAYFIAWTVS